MIEMEGQTRQAAYGIPSALEADRIRRGYDGAIEVIICRRRRETRGKWRGRRDVIVEERGPGRVIRAWIFLPKGSCGAQCTIKISSPFTNVASSGANNTRMTCNLGAALRHLCHV